MLSSTIPVKPKDIHSSVMDDKQKLLEAGNQKMFGICAW